MATIPYTPAYSYGSLARSLSRAPSVSYAAPQPLVYSQSIYGGDIPRPYSTVPYAMHDYSRSSTSLIPLSRRLTGLPYEDIQNPYYSSSGHVALPRSRRCSTASFMTRHGMGHFPTHHKIRFKRKGAFSAGITLSEAQAHVRLSNNDHYTLFDLNADGAAAVLLAIRWSGHPSMTYQIPLDGRDSRVSLQTLARRISRACVHYLESNAIPVMRDRVELHHIEEIAHGVWQPMLRAF